MALFSHYNHRVFARSNKSSINFWKYNTINQQSKTFAVCFKNNCQMYEYLHLWFLWKTWNHWEYPEKNVLLYTIDQDIFYFILNLRFIFVTYVFVPYFVIFMECFVECYRQKLIFKINWKIGTPIPIVNKRKIQFRIRLLTRMNFFLWFSSSMSSISSRSMSTLFGNSVWKINEIIKKCRRCIQCSAVLCTLRSDASNDVQTLFNLQIDNVSPEI